VAQWRRRCAGDALPGVGHCPNVLNDAPCHRRVELKFAWFYASAGARATARSNWSALGCLLVSPRGRDAPRGG
jgi:hypothetical protein